MARAETAAIDKRRLILDAAVRVFARQGFHTCRVSDIADEAGVAYGLVYHYFSSKDEILDTLFLERWSVMLAAIAEADASEQQPRDKLRAIAAFMHLAQFAGEANAFPGSWPGADGEEPQGRSRRPANHCHDSGRTDHERLL